MKKKIVTVILAAGTYPIHVAWVTRSAAIKDKFICGPSTRATPFFQFLWKSTVRNQSGISLYQSNTLSGWQAMRNLKVINGGKNSSKKSGQTNNPLNVGKSCDTAIKI